MMAGTHCAQCSDTRNIYIKTCDCSKNQVNQQFESKNNSIKKDSDKVSTVDTKKQPEEPKLRAVKAVVYKVVRVYETVPSKTMKFIGALALLLLLVAVFSVALAQNKEETKSQYGMAFPLEDSASVNSESRVAIIGSVPGEGSQTQTTTETTSELPVTTTFLPSTEETPVTPVSEENDKKSDDIEINDQNPTFVIASNDDEDDKQLENGEEKVNPRLVFIERLMGLHLSAPMNGQNPEKEREENSAVENGPQLPFRNPFDKVNAKWASRMRKFSIPLMQQQEQQHSIEQPNPLLRYAAAAMMTRLLAAAARAHDNGPMAKDKDDDSEEETMPVLLATMRSGEDERDGPFQRPMPPMYGRPMPRPPMMRPPMRPPVKFIQNPQSRMASVNVPQRVFSAQMVPQRSPMIHRPLPPYQPVLVMLAHVPMPLQSAESRMGSSHVSVNPYYAPQQQQQQHSMPIYPQVPYAIPMGYHHPMQRQMMPIDGPSPVHVQHVPVHIPVASYHRPIYQSPYQTGPYQRHSSRPVIEIPIEIPVPVHVPVPVSYHSSNSMHNDVEHDTSASEAEQVAIVYYDPDQQESNDHEVNHHFEPQMSESHENIFRVAPQQKGYPFLSHPLPDTQSPTKMKLWREYVGAKHAANPGVRYIPVAVASDDSQSHDSHDSHHIQDNPQTAESQPAFVILADDSADPSQEHH